MNKKGFTLVELLATLVVLGVIISITVVSINSVFKNTKNKSEDVFVDTIEDAMEMYLNSSQVKGLSSWDLCGNTLNKIHGNVKVYKTTIYFDSVINSDFKPITQADLINPANEDVDCNNASDINVNIYRDDDYVYYYSIDKSSFGCLTNSGVITNLPVLDSGEYYTCN